MFARRLLQGFLVGSVISALIGCSNPQGLDSVVVSPSTQALTVGQTVQFTATGTYGNATHASTQTITGSVTWASSTPSVATVSAAGLATAVGSGTTTITASAAGFSGPVSSSATLTITGSSGGTAGGSIVSLAVIPGNQSLAASGQTSQFLAIGTTSSAATENLTNQVVWSSSSPAIATVGATTGLATAVGSGSATITALYTNASGGTVVAGTATISVTGSTGGVPAGNIVSIAVIPGSQSVAAPGQTSQFLAIGTTFSGATENLTNQVTWSSSSTGIATVGSTTGLATAVGAGTTTVAALYTNASGGTAVTGTATFSVTGSGGGTAGGSIASIAVIPGSQSVAAPGQTSQFLAIGTTSSGATENLTNQVAWSSSSAAIATVGANTGLTTAVGQGSATITALYSSGGSVVAGTATFSVSGGTTEKYTGVSITPSSQALSASGQTSQLIAIGTLGSTGLNTEVSGASQITWASSVPSIATVSSTGLVTGVSAGNTTISAVLTNTDGTVVSATAAIAVSATAAPEPLLSLQVIPSSITVDNLQDTGQFLAIGTFSTAPYVRDLTNSPSTTWISDVPSVFPVDTNSAGNSGATAGLVTAYGSGNANIIAEAKGSDGTIQTASATFNCPEALPNPAGDPPTVGTCNPGTQAQALLSTLTIYNEGPNTTTWEVTAPSATGTADVIHCGPGWTGTGGSVCVATYPLPTTTTLGVGVTVLITATQPTGTGTFGGWSYNCTPSTSTGSPLPGPVYWNAAGPNYCTVTFLPTLLNPNTGAVVQIGNTNVTVGAIFN